MLRVHSHTVSGTRGDVVSPIGGSHLDGGGIAIKTFIRGASPATSIFAVQKLVAGNNGDTHTLDRYTQWLVDAGFDEPWLVDRDAPTLLLANFGDRRPGATR